MYSFNQSLANSVISNAFPSHLVSIKPQVCFQLKFMFFNNLQNIIYWVYSVYCIVGNTCVQILPSLSTNFS